MADQVSLESLQELHRELVAISERRLENLPILERLLDFHTESLKKLLEENARRKESRDVVQSGGFPQPM
jgi:ribosomal 50S subunit-associated protein YjgA (DUF615 family)